MLLLQTDMLWVKNKPFIIINLDEKQTRFTKINMFTCNKRGHTQKLHLANMTNCSKLTGKALE